MFKCIDLFCGIGGFRVAANQASKDLGIDLKWVFSCDIDSHAQQTYFENFEDYPQSDITTIESKDIPDHDLLFAGFPCQPFSICGDLKGFEDSRGTLFFEIARILREKRPVAFVLENVKQLVGHNHGKTLRRILDILHEIGYFADYKVLNGLDFGIPHKRERIFIVGFREPYNFDWPTRKIPMQSLADLLETKVSDFYYASPKIRQSRLEKFEGKLPEPPTIWHENKSGHLSAYPYSCAMRAGASYNYLLVNGERRLTEREMLRLLGFPDSFKIIYGYSIMRKLAGNSIVVPCALSVIKAVLLTLKNPNISSSLNYDIKQLAFL
ncbi:DNA cytosine methyltransferase [Synechococcus sp. PCC 6312]|uniref:DNA cytosine methyltransferase n=1 Tax=Synechococcus sp. (strain ATCC 27167 / PCC 6312) TaxID=195253 RepID=UPI00029EF02D|nr:DNA (cytosine-5-)-methyltransferase [Synechococcus sp. PCC 6312]AFY61495.1 DNA-methyltransferase Dcm [Synechococcus sp. PCC 6312]